MRRCCSARVSVGTRMAACVPASTAWHMARTATSVLPEPTSPCSRRRIGRGRVRSRPIWPAARRCAGVRVNGRASSSGRERSPVAASTGAAPAWSWRRRTASRPSWRIISSSTTRRRRPRRLSRRERGKWTATSASAAPGSARRSRTHAGSRSGAARARGRARSTSSRMRRTGICSVAGYTGTSPRVWRPSDPGPPMTSCVRTVISRRPSAPTLPRRSSSSPGCRTRARCSWLNHVAVAAPVASRTRARTSRRPRRRVGRTVMSSSRTRTVTSSPPAARRGGARPGRRPRTASGGAPAGRPITSIPRAAARRAVVAPTPGRSVIGASHQPGPGRRGGGGAGHGAPRPRPSGGVGTAVRSAAVALGGIERA